MNRVNLACIRILFFVMLFISTACNKMDRSLSAAELPAAPAAAVADSASPDERVSQLDARVRFLEAELSRVNKQDSLFSDIPGGVTWD